MKIISIGASSAGQSINQRLADTTASLVEGAEVTRVLVSDYEMPLYSVDREEADGLPQLAKDFVQVLGSGDAIVLSLAEHNGSYTAAFKNVLDWASRVEKSLFAERPMLLLATSPGARGAQTVLESAKAYFPHLGANIVGSLSVPWFYDHFSDDGPDDETREQLTELSKKLKL